MSCLLLQISTKMEFLPKNFSLLFSLLYCFHNAVIQSTMSLIQIIILLYVIEGTFTNHHRCAGRPRPAQIPYKIEPTADRVFTFLKNLHFIVRSQKLLK